MPLLCATELTRFTRIRHPRKQQEYLLSRALMRHALQCQFSRSTSAWHFSETGKLPEISGLPQSWYYSLSHSKQLIGFVLAQTPVGIDIESVERHRSTKALASITTADDLAVLQSIPNLPADQWFFHSWCLKEAWYKAHVTHQRDAAMSTELGTIMNSGWTSQTAELAQHRFALVTAEPTNLSCHVSLPFSANRRISLSNIRVVVNSGVRDQAAFLSD